MTNEVLRNIRLYLEWLQERGFLYVRDSEHRCENSASASSPRKVEELGKIAEEVAHCRKCKLGSLRKQPVFGIGNPDADLVFIGEAPGAREDETGIPFVGAAGNLLTEELARHGIRREDVYICNILKCRPPNNRDPLPDEISACEPYLLRQLDILKPKMLCALGRFAAMTLLKRPISIMKIRGSWQRYHDIPLFICLHPAAVLHQPQNRNFFEADIATLADCYHRRNEKMPEVAEDGSLLA